MNKYLEKIAYMKDLYEDLGLQKEDIPEEFVAGTLAAGGGIAFHTVNKRSITPVARSAYLPHLRNIISDVKGEADLETLTKFVKENNLDLEFLGGPSKSRGRHEKVLNKAMGRVIPDAPPTDSVTAFNKILKGDFEDEMRKATRESVRQYGPAYAPVGKVGNESFSNVFKGDVITMGNTPGKIMNRDVLMHELGHAKDFSVNGAAKIRASHISKSLTKASPFITTAMLVHPESAKYSPYVAALIAAADLRSEAVANIHAARAIQKSKGNRAALRSIRKTLGPSFLSYVIPHAGLVGATLLGSIVAKKYHEGVGRDPVIEKEASTTNRYLEKIAKTQAAVKPIDTTPDIKTDLKAGQKGRGTLSLRNSLEKALENTPRMKSLREISSEGAEKSYVSSVRKGSSNPASNAVREMQERASTPRSSSTTTKQRLK